jgi:putative membrane protein
MTTLVWVFALLTAAIHIVVFVLEALVIERPAVHQGVFSVPTADVPAIRLWAFGVGFYNLFIGCGLVAGVALWAGGDEAAGRALVIYLCLTTFLAGLVLLAADRLELSRVRGTSGWYWQSGPPFVALVALVALAL